MCIIIIIVVVINNNINNNNNNNKPYLFKLVRITKYIKSMLGMCVCVIIL